MRYTILLAALLACLPVCANDTILTDLTTRLQQADVLPAVAVNATPTHFKIVALPTGALARWNPKTDTFEVSKSVWKKAPHTAPCLLPLLAHETIHAYLYKAARAHGFAWPITLQDEVLAHYYQLKTEQTRPDYANICAAWRPQLPAERAAFTQQNWTTFKEAIFTRYSRLGGARIPPPPLTPFYVEQAKAHKAWPLFEHTYRCARHFSAEKFWRKGGNWFCVKSAERALLLQSPYYTTYQQILHSISL